MSLDYSYVETFATKVSEPDVFDAVGGADQFFAELGKIARAIQDKTMTAADAQSAKVVLQNFSDGISRLNARIVYAGDVLDDDNGFQSATASRVNNCHFALAQCRFHVAARKANPIYRDLGVKPSLDPHQCSLSNCRICSGYRRSNKPGSLTIKTPLGSRIHVCHAVECA